MRSHLAARDQRLDVGPRKPGGTTRQKSDRPKAASVHRAPHSPGTDAQQGGDLGSRQNQRNVACGRVSRHLEPSVV